jgi:4-hydroxybenzoate polyprenyltransferase
MSLPAIALLAVFFVLFETTYEILYDFRDLEGDRLLHVPTYPVVHGPQVAQRIMAGLLLGSVATLLLGVWLGHLGVRELLMAVAPLSQFGFYRPRLAKGLTSQDCLWLTHLGSAQLLLFLVGTALWQHAGLPANIFLR